MCNQDSLEQLFSRLRVREGFNMNPSSRMVRLTIRILVAVQNVVSTSKGNVACDDQSYLPAITKAQLDGELQTVIDPAETNEQRMVQYFEAGTLDDNDENVEAHYETYEKIDQQEDEDENDIDEFSVRKEEVIQESSPFNPLRHTCFRGTNSYDNCYIRVLGSLITNQNSDFGNSKWRIQDGGQNFKSEFIFVMSDLENIIMQFSEKSNNISIYGRHIGSAILNYQNLRLYS